MRIGFSAIPVVAALLLLGCSTDGESVADAVGQTTTESAPTETSTTAVPDYTGDSGSTFCGLLRQAGERPVLDPFEAGLEPREIELRLRTLLVRFDELLRDAPAEITSDIELVATGLLALDDALSGHAYDLGAAAEAGENLAFLDAPEFADVATRIAAYETQVCDA